MTQRILDEIALLEEPLQRAQAATTYVHLLLAAKRRVAVQRIAEVTELKGATGLSQRDIAQALGVSGTVVAQVENGARGRPAGNARADRRGRCGTRAGSRSRT